MFLDVARHPVAVRHEIADADHQVGPEAQPLGIELALLEGQNHLAFDAVLLLGPDANETAGLIAAEDPGGPPLFASADSGEVRGARRLGAAAGESVLEELIRALEPGSPSNEQGG